MKRIITAAAIGLACMVGAAGAQTPQAEDVIKGRQGAMMLSGVAMASIKGAIDAGQPLASQRFSTRSLARWAHAVPGMFPAGSGPEAGVQSNASALPDTAVGSAPAAGATIVTRLKPEAAPVTYEVQAGDTLSGIAFRYAVSVDTLTTLNGLDNPDLIQPGTLLLIPATVEEQVGPGSP